MLEDMQIRHLATSTQRAYVEHVSRFARHFGRSPALVGPEEIPAYQVYLTNEKQLAPASMVITVAALRFLYTVTLQRTWSVEAVIPAPKTPQTSPVVLSPAEVVQFLGCVAAPKHRVILTTCYAAGPPHLGSRAAHPASDRPPANGPARRAREGAERSLRHAVPDAAPDAARVVADESIPPLAVSRRSLRRADHHPCGERACRKAHRRSQIPKAITPHALRHYAASPR